MKCSLIDHSRCPKQNPLNGDTTSDIVSKMARWSNVDRQAMATAHKIAVGIPQNRIPYLHTNAERPIVRVRAQPCEELSDMITPGESVTE